MRLASALLLILSGSITVTTLAQSPAPQTYTLSTEITQDDVRALVTVWRDGSKERIEMAAQGASRKMITLFDFDAHTVYWLFPGVDPPCSSGRYLSARGPVGGDLVTGSAQTLAEMPKGSQRKFVRQEAVNGMPARVEEISYPANARLVDASDLLAERAVQLGGVAEGTVRHAAGRSSLDEYAAGGGGEEHVPALADALADFGLSARRAIASADREGDQDTVDIFTGISRGTDKWLWMVEAHLQGDEALRPSRQRGDADDAHPRP